MKKHVFLIIGIVVLVGAALAYVCYQLVLIAKAVDQDDKEFSLTSYQSQNGQHEQIIEPEQATP